MELTTEDGTVIRDPSSSELRTALGKIGSRGNGYAILAAAAEHYIQVAGTDAEGYVAEYREGSEETHHASTGTNLSREQIVDLMTAYLSGASWKAMLSWEAGFGSKPIPDRPDGAHRAVVVLFFVMGAAFLVQGVRENFATRLFLHRAVEVPGRVVQLVRHSNTYEPVVEYKDLQGNLHRLQPSMHAKSTAFQQGEYVTVIYDPADAVPASTAKIATFSRLWSSSLFMLVLGTGFIVIATFHGLIAFRRRRQ